MARYSNLRSCALKGLIVQQTASRPGGVGRGPALMISLSCKPAAAAAASAVNTLLPKP